MIDSTFDRDNQTFSPSKKTLYPKPSTLDRVWHLSLPAFTGCGPLLQMECPTLGSHISHLPFFTLPKLYPTWIRLALVWLVLRPTVRSTLKEGKLGKSHFGVKPCDSPSLVGKCTVLWYKIRVIAALALTIHIQVFQKSITINAVLLDFSQTIKRSS